MSYHNLVDIGLNVDLSALDEKIDEIDQKIADLGGEDILDEDAVQRLIDAGDFVSRDDLSDYVDESRVEEIVRDLMHSEGDDFVQGVIDNGSYVTEYEVDDKIREAIDDSTPDDDAVRAIVESVTDGRLHKLDQRIDEVDNEADNRIGSLANLIGDSNKRIEALEAKLESGDVGQALTFFGLLRQAFNALRI